jgi:hypothetical protein
MNKLTERTSDGIAYTKIPLNESHLNKRVVIEQCFTGFVADRLAAYEDSGLSPEEVQELAKFKALSQLKVGNIVYHITQTGQIEEILIDCIGATGTLLNGDIAIIPAGNFGKTVFITKEAAEKAIGGKEDV